MLHSAPLSLITTRLSEQVSLNHDTEPVTFRLLRSFTDQMAMTISPEGVTSIMAES